MANPSILVDSSIWIEGLNPQAPHAIQQRLKALTEANRVVITEMIRLEVIAGARTLDEFKDFRADFGALRCLGTTSQEWWRAEELSFVLGRKGLRVPPADILIAAVAMSHEVPLWHADKDFERIKQVAPDFESYWHPQKMPEI